MNPWIVTAAVVIALILPGAGSLRAAEPSDIVIGLSTSTTGPYIVNSATTQIGVDLAVDEINRTGGINGHKIRIVQFDTGGNPQQAQVAVRQFAEDDGALAVIGPFSSGECRVAFPAGERLGIVEITNGATAPSLTKGFKYAFQNTSDELTQFHRLLTTVKAKKLPIASAAIIYASDEFISKSLGEGIYPAGFSQDGVPVVAKVSFPLAAFDLSPQVGQLMQHSADVTAVGGTVDAAVKLVHEMRRQGDKSRVIGSGVIADPTIAQKVGADGEGMLYPTFFWPDRDSRTRDFARRFAIVAQRLNFPRSIPMHNDASAYDVVHIIAEAAKRAQVTGDPAKVASERTALRDQITQMKSWNMTGLLGRSYFNPDGSAQLPTYIVEVHNAKLQLLGTIETQ